MNRHVEALAEEFLGRGHDVRVLAPFDPPGRVSRVAAPRRARAARDPRLPDAARPHDGLRRQRRRLQPRALPRRRGRRAASRAAPRRTSTSSTSTSRWRHWSAGTRPSGARRPAVGTFHAYSTKPIPNYIANGARRPPHVQPPLGPDRRLRGGRLDRAPLVRRRLRDHPQRGRRRRRAERPEAAGEELRILFVGRPEERKGLPVLLTAFGALVEHVPCRLTVIGAEREDVLRYLADPETMRSIDVHGRVSGESSGASCTRPTCSAPPRSPARASAWS